ncbi:MAG: hypothetical protein Q9195_002683 [Heterodermia aff. obscurata]
MFYTTASAVLVKPQLGYGKTKSMMMRGNVSTSFANSSYTEEHCPTPITPGIDIISSSTCISIEHAGQSYHNYMQYLSQWSSKDTSQRFSFGPTKRPNPVAMLNDNVTITGSWIEAKDMEKVSATYKRVVNNNLGGEYHVQASVPSPSVNVICARMTETELAPLVYQQWPNHGSLVPNGTNWPQEFDIPRDLGWMNKTLFDDVFGFGRKYNRIPPLFPKLPQPYNTILNSTAQPLDSVYILAGAPDSSNGGKNSSNNYHNYTLCSLRMSITPNCSTSYNVSSGGGSLFTQCEEPSDSLVYLRTHQEAPIGLVNSQWIDIASRWAKSISLNDGISDFNASNARLLTQLMPTDSSLNPSLPTMAEALAVLSGCTLILSSTDAPFDNYWDGSLPVVSIPGQQEFQALVRSQQFISGGLKPWQGIFYIVLFPMFLLNCYCLVHVMKWLFSGDKGLMIDVTEPQNTFAMAVNSPQTSLVGSSGCEPSKEQCRRRWNVRHDRERDRYYLSSGLGGMNDSQWEQPELELLSGKGSPAIIVSPQL